jgi:cytochrome c5
VTCALALGVSAALAQGELPPGPGVEPVRAQCLTCHEADLIAQQRLTRAGWEREIDKMIRWGARVAPGERDAMLDYLAARFGPRPEASRPEQAGAARGAAIYESRCLTCHEADLVVQQRLARGTWAREVDKMVRWGAAVGESEKDALVDYLAARFGPRR